LYGKIWWLLFLWCMIFAWIHFILLKYLTISIFLLADSGAHWFTSIQEAYNWKILAMVQS
jgi:hypothetical protein